MRRVVRRCIKGGDEVGVGFGGWGRKKGEGSSSSESAEG